MKYKYFRGISIFWGLFIGLGALAGGIGMLVAPDGSALGMQAIIPMFQVLPFADVLFQNFIFSGISLIIVNGVTQLVAFALVLSKNKYAGHWSMTCGILLMLWIIIQFCIFPLNFMSTIYFVFGFLESLNAYFMIREGKKK